MYACQGKTILNVQLTFRSRSDNRMQHSCRTFGKQIVEPGTSWSEILLDPHNRDYRTQNYFNICPTEMACQGRLAVVHFFRLLKQSNAGGGGFVI